MFIAFLNHSLLKISEILLNLRKRSKVPLHNHYYNINCIVLKCRNIIDETK